MRLEYLVVRAEINDLKVGVGVIYNPSGANQLFAQQYEKLLIDLLEFDLDQTYLIGDYNINVATSTPSTNILALQRIHATFGLTVLPTPPTRITETSSTTIDLIVTDHPETIQCSKTATGNTISDHEVIYFISRLRIHKPPPKRIKVRNFRRIDPQALQIDFQASNLQQIYEAEDVDTKTELLTTTLQSLMQRHAPERTILVRDQRTPWITAQIEREISTRDIAFALYNRNPNRARGDAQWCDYVRKRDRTKTLIFEAKKRYAERNFAHNLPAKKLWCNLRRDGIHNNAKKVLPEEAADPDTLNRFFTGGHRLLGNQVEPANQTSSRQEPRPTEPINPRPNSFGFRHTTVREVAATIFEIQTCAAGSDGIPITVVKLLSPIILPVLVHIFNAIIDAQRFPSGWKKAVVTPIPKKSCPVAPNDFRPISVLPAVSKILEKILLLQISDYLNEAEPPLIAANQSGYRKGYSTSTALTKVTHDIYANLDNGRCTLLVLVDFSVAFNCVKHRKLEDKLRNEFNFSTNATRLISSYLNGRSQMVRVAEATSTELPLHDGTPQGSCLSSMLFSLYINSIAATIECEYHLYADDLQLYVSGSIEELDILVAKINRDLAAIERWSIDNGLFPNPKKTQAILFTKNGTVTPNSNIVFCSERVELSNSVTNLGLKLDNNLRWVDQVNHVTRSVYSTLRTFRRFSAVLSTETRMKLVVAVIGPIFMYCDSVYYPGLSAAHKEQLNRVFKSSVRFVYNLARRDSTAALRSTIFGRDLQANYHYRICGLFWKGLHNQLPSYLMQHLRRGQMDRTRSFVIPTHTTSAGKSLLVYGAQSWNRLPLAMRNSPTVSAFRSAMNAH